MSIEGFEIASKFEGKGYLRQGDDGAISYKLYATLVSGIDPHYSLQSWGTPGSLIPKDRYYQLEARAIDGTNWYVNWTLPNVNTGFREGTFYHVVEGSADGMSSRCAPDIAISKHYLAMAFFDEIDIPCNTRTVTRSTIGGDETKAAHSLHLDVAEFDTAFGAFRISKKPGMIQIEVQSDAEFFDSFESRIIEALGLVLARPLYWNVRLRCSKDAEVLGVRGKSIVVNARLLRPVGESWIDQTGDVWQLFNNYLTYICRLNDNAFHPCSRHLFPVLEASAGAMSARGLALGVAVEGIVKAAFPEAGALPSNLRPIVRRLRKHFRRWEEWKDSNIRAALCQRVENMLGKLLDVSTKSKSYALADEHAVYSAHIEAWADL
jgi:hypothetical protein